MKIKLHIHLIVLLNFFIMFSNKAQDTHFSQFYMTPLALNPAMAGAQHDMRAVLNYKNQWSSVAQPYSTGNLSYDMRINSSTTSAVSAIGINVSQDKSGNPYIKTFQASVAYANQIKVSAKSRLGVGLYAGVIQRSINYEGLKWMNQYDGMQYNSALANKEPEGRLSLLCADVGAGLHYEYSKNEKYMTGNDHRKFSAGIAAFHVNQPSYSFYGSNERLYVKFGGYMMGEIGVGNSDVSLCPGVYYYMQGSAKELLVGNLFQIKLRDDSKYTGYVQSATFSIGGYYRGRDAAIIASLLKWNTYAVGLSYDFNVSGLKSASKGRGGFEISLRYTNPSGFLYKAKPSID